MIAIKINVKPFSIFCYNRHGYYLKPVMKFILSQFWKKNCCVNKLQCKNCHTHRILRTGNWKVVTIGKCINLQVCMSAVTLYNLLSYNFELSLLCLRKCFAFSNFQYFFSGFLLNAELRIDDIFFNEHCLHFLKHPE